MSSPEFSGTSLPPLEGVQLQPLVPLEPLQPLDEQPLEPLQPVQPLMPPPLPPAAAGELVPEAAPAQPVSAEEIANLGVPLGTLIFRAGLLTEEQLEDALEEGMRTGRRLGEVLVDSGQLDDRDLGRLLAGQKGLSFVELSSLAPDPSAVSLLSPEKARMYAALPVGFEAGVPLVAVADPSNELVTENLRRALGSEPRLVVAGRSDLLAAIDRLHGAVAEPAPAEQPAVAPAAAPVEPLAPLAAPEPVAYQAVAPEPVVPEPVAPALFAQEPVVQEPVVPEPVSPEPVAQEPVVQQPVMPLVQEPEAPAAWTPPVVEQPVPPVEPVVQVDEPAQALPTSFPPPPPRPVTHEPEPELELAEPPAPVFAAQPVTVPEPEPVAEPVHQPETVPVSIPEPVSVIATESAPPPVLPLVPQAAEPTVEDHGPVAESSVTVEPLTPVQPPALAPVEPVELETVPVETFRGVEPVPAPVDQEVEPEELPSAMSYDVSLRLSDGERVPVGSFGDPQKAREYARDVVRHLSEDADGWPFFSGRFMRPDTIISVDIVPVGEPDRWLGSSARANWASRLNR